MKHIFVELAKTFSHRDFWKNISIVLLAAAINVGCSKPKKAVKAPLGGTGTGSGTGTGTGTGTGSSIAKGEPFIDIGNGNKMQPLQLTELDRADGGDRVGIPLLELSKGQFARAGVNAPTHFRLVAEVGQPLVTSGGGLTNNPSFGNRLFANLNDVRSNVYYAAVVNVSAAVGAYAGFMWNHHDPNNTGHCFKFCRLVRYATETVAEMGVDYGTIEVIESRRSVPSTVAILEAGQYDHTAICSVSPQKADGSFDRSGLVGVTNQKAIDEQPYLHGFDIKNGGIVALATVIDLEAVKPLLGGQITLVADAFERAPGTFNSIGVNWQQPIQQSMTLDSFNTSNIFVRPANMYGFTPTQSVGFAVLAGNPYYYHMPATYPDHHVVNGGHYATSVSIRGPDTDVQAEIEFGAPISGVSGTCTAAAWSGPCGGVVARYAGSNANVDRNMIFLGLRLVGSTHYLELYKNIGGTWHQVRSEVAGPGAVNVGGRNLVRLTTHGSGVVGYLNGQNLLSATISELVTYPGRNVQEHVYRGQLSGIRAFHAAVDNFKLRAVNDSRLYND